MNTSEQTSWLNVACPDGGFLQSEAWRAFKEREGFCTEHFDGEGLWANIIEHRLPMAGKYWYMPRGPVFELPTSNFQLPTCKFTTHNVQSANFQLPIPNSRLSTTNFQFPIAIQWKNIIDTAKKGGVGWVRVEPRNEEELALLREWSRPYEMKKALHDMQPREILVMDILKSEEEILAGMKAKTRYNVRLAEKRGVEVSLERDENTIREFLRMIRETAARNRIVAHPAEHYIDLLEFFPRETLELFVARREEKILATILVSFFGDTATYLHGASSDDERGLMAPYLLQFRAISEAKKRGCIRYDFGGIDTTGMRPSLVGVTRFKRGFAESVKTIRYSGSYDIILLPSRFFLYEMVGMSKIFVKKAIYSLTKV